MKYPQGSHALYREISKQEQRINDYKTNHILHLLLCVITAGLWIPFWAVTALSNGNERAKAKMRLERLESALSKSEREVEEIV